MVGRVPKRNDLQERQYVYRTRRTETQMLDESDVGCEPNALEVGGFRSLVVRQGKVKRSSPPMRRTVSKVWRWVVEMPVQWFTEHRPLFRIYGNLGAWPSEREPRVSAALQDRRTAEYQKAIGPTSTRYAAPTSRT